MNTLSQNWVWIVIGLGVLVFLFRGGHLGLGGFGHCGFGHAGHGHGRDYLGGHDNGEGAGEARQDYAAPARPPESAIDPVSGAAVRVADAVTSVHQGRVHYFASKENRDRFEASPGEFAAKAAAPSVIGMLVSNGLVTDGADADRATLPQRSEPPTPQSLRRTPEPF